MLRPRLCPEVSLAYISWGSGHTPRLFPSPCPLQRSRGRVSIRLPVPEPLVPLAKLYCEHAWYVLTHASEEPRTLFLTSTGLPFKASRFSQYWRAMMAPRLSASFPPRLLRWATCGSALTCGVLATWAVPRLPADTCTTSLHPNRHIFVENRMDNPLAPGPAHADAAVAMGNSVAAWEVRPEDVAGPSWWPTYVH